MNGIEVRELCKSYGDTEILRSVSLSVPVGSVAVVVGASGCGKTTLLRCIAGFEGPSAGSITVGSRAVAGDAWVPAHKRSVGYVTQDGALFPHLSVGANIGFGLPRSTRSQERIAKLLSAVALSPAMASRRPDQLSGGQQQQVSLARALALQPSVMLLDEPFSALDTGLRQRTREVIGGVLRDAGITTVLVTHDHEEALSFAGQLAVMDAGLFRQIGSPESIYAKPINLATARSLGDVIVLNGVASNGLAVTSLGVVPVINALDGPVSVVLRPEQVIVSRGTSNMAKILAVVTRSVFHGTHVRLVIRTEGGDEVTLRSPVADAPRVGDTVRVIIQGDVQIYPP